VDVLRRWGYALILMSVVATVAIIVMLGRGDAIEGRCGDRVLRNENVRCTVH
jgi:hypothetical protein